MTTYLRDQLVILSPSHLVTLSLLRLKHTGVLRRPLGLPQPHCADLVLRDFRDRVLCGDRKLVGALAAGPVIRNKDRVGPDSLDHARPQRAIAPARLDRGPIAVGDAQALGQLRVYLDKRLGRVVDQRADPPGLSAG